MPQAYIYGCERQMSLLPRKEQKFSASVNAGQRAAKARRVKRVVDNFSESARNIGDDAELILQARAPRRSGRLARGIRAVSTGEQVFVTAVAVDPKSQYDYVAVTRFGHRKDRIYPVNKRGKVRKSRSRKLTKAGVRRQGTLVFESRGKKWFFHSVRGFKPAGDWVERAWPEIQVSVATELKKTGNQIEVAWAE